MKKIIIFMPSIEGGGVEKNLFIVTNYLAKKFKNLSLISVSNSYKKKFNKSVNFISYTSSIWDKFPRRFKYFLSLILLLKEIIKDKKIIVFSFQANIYCIIICKLFNIKIIVRSNSAPAGWSKNFLKRYIFKFFLNRADKVMANSFEFINSLKREFNVKATCIYNPLNISEIKKKSKLKTRKFYKTKNLKILNIGRFTEQKDQITLLKALKKLKGKVKFEALIVGRGVLSESLNNFIFNNRLNNNIKLISFLENPYPVIKQCDIFVLSSKYEGLPNVLLESISLNKFVISSNCPTGPKEILLNGKGGLLFQPSNYDELEKKITYFVKNKKKCEKMLKYAQKNLYRFDYNKNLFKYYRLINSVN